MMRRASARLDIVGRYNTEGGRGALQKAKRTREALPSHVLFIQRMGKIEFCINSDNALSSLAAYF